MRTRDIKPGFYLNEDLAECSCWARLIFPGLWMLADREGRLEYRPKRIKAEILPYDGEDMAALIGELEAHGLVKRYEVDGKEYLWIPTFSRHQKPHPNEKASEIPPCPEADTTKKELTSRLSDSELAPRNEVSITKVISSSHQGDSQSGLLSLSSSSLSPREDSTLTSFECLSPPVGDDAPATGPDGQEYSTALAAESPSLKAQCPERKDVPPCPYEQIRDMYHAAFPEHARVALLSAKRKGAVKARWGDAGKRLRELKRPDSAAERLAYFQRLFNKAAMSDFLTGKRTFRDGSVYRVDFDKLMSPGGFVGVIEGKYDNRPEA
jgi:hypothetical protein|nr:MAG TPA: replisome organizer [Caudoviricetes sp.]